MSSESSRPSFDGGCGSEHDFDVSATAGAAGGRGNLVAFYSLSGNTRAVAEEIRDAAGGRLEEIREPRPRAGFPGEVGALYDSLLRRAPSIRPPLYDPGHFDLLLLGGPVWAGRIAAPVRTYAKQLGARARRVRLFCTYDADGAFEALQEMAELLGQRPEAVLAVPAHSVVSAGHAAALHRFVGDALASPRSVPLVHRARAWAP
jgi:flavodoxin